MAVLVRWEPWQWLVPSSGEDRWMPACDMFARGGDLVVRMELPGIDPAADVQVRVQDGVLCVSGERRRDAAADQAGYWRRESAYGAFERGIPLPEGTKVEAITASYDSGVLEIVIPKAAQLPEPMRIPVHTGNGEKAVTAGTAKP
jgi:HSP20 family molecular chaperone IbpA